MACRGRIREDSGLSNSADPNSREFGYGLLQLERKVREQITALLSDEHKAQIKKQAEKRKSRNRKKKKDNG